jgi:hypothetical protein
MRSASNGHEPLSRTKRHWMRCVGNAFLRQSGLPESELIERGPEMLFDPFGD